MTDIRTDLSTVQRVVDAALEKPTPTALFRSEFTKAFGLPLEHPNCTRVSEAEVEQAERHRLALVAIGIDADFAIHLAADAMGDGMLDRDGLVDLVRVDAELVRAGRVH